MQHDSFVRFKAAFLIVFSLMVVSCGGLSESEKHLRYGTMQEHEAQLDRLRNQEPSDCEAQRQEVQHLCSLANEINEADAKIRCERARQLSEGCAP